MQRANLSVTDFSGESSTARVEMKHQSMIVSRAETGSWSEVNMGMARLTSEWMRAKIVRPSSFGFFVIVKS